MLPDADGFLSLKYLVILLRVVNISEEPLDELNWERQVKNGVQVGL